MDRYGVERLNRCKPSGSHLEQVAATVEDGPRIRALFSRAYGAEWPEEDWKWKFLRNPDGWFGVVAETEEGEIVGNFSGWPMQFT